MEDEVDVHEVVLTEPLGKPVRARIYGFPEGMVDYPMYEIRWEVLDKKGRTIYDSGSERDAYTSADEDQIPADVEAKFPGLPLTDERVT